MTNSKLQSLIRGIEELESKVDIAPWDTSFVSGLVPQIREIVCQDNRHNPIAKDLDIPTAMFLVACRNNLPTLLALAKSAEKLAKAIEWASDCEKGCPCVLCHVLTEHNTLLDSL